MRLSSTLRRRLSAIARGARPEVRAPAGPSSRFHAVRDEPTRDAAPHATTARDVAAGATSARDASAPDTVASDTVAPAAARRAGPDAEPWWRRRFTSRFGPARPAESVSSRTTPVSPVPTTGGTPPDPEPPAARPAGDALGTSARPSRPDWTDHPRLFAPSPFRSRETSRGSILARELEIPCPPSLLASLPADVPETTLFLDTETLGLGSQMIFLVGLASVTGERVVVEQIFAADIDREGALLAGLADRLSRAQRVVTYNGRSYDLPLLRDRAARHRIRPWPRPSDVDLLHAARRAWKTRLPNCRLVSIERHVFGRERSGDVPGGDVPRLYRQAIRGGDRRILAPVFLHNALDLLSLVELCAALGDQPVWRPPASS